MKILALENSAKVVSAALTKDWAVFLADLAQELKDNPRPKTAAGDGAGLCQAALAEAGSAEAAISEMKRWGCTSIKLMVLLAAPKGIERIQKAHPDVIFTAVP